jgi:ribosomal protein S12 methylthiotransferase accessory factor
MLLAGAECKRLGLTPEHAWLGPPGRPTASVRLRDRAGQHVASGGGKGAGAQCTASAALEALEHLHLDRGLPTARSRPAEVRSLAAAEVADQPQLDGDTLVRRLAAEHPGSLVECLRYVSPWTGAAVWYPAFIKNPRYRRHPGGDERRDLRAYHRYSSGNGTAGGVNPVEAVLHGTLELVKRDAVSLAYLDWYLDGRGPLQRIDPDCLPDDLAELVELARRVLGAPRLLLDVTTDLGIPVVLALPSRRTPAAPMPGAGASLDGRYAVERALDELLQVVSAERIETRERRDRLLRGRMLDPWPDLRAVFDLDPEQLLRLGAVPVAVPQSVAVTRGPVAQLSRVTDLLAAAGLTLFTSPWTPPESLVAVHSTLVPGLESFCLVQTGVPVRPTGRARPDLVGADQFGAG